MGGAGANGGLGAEPAAGERPEEEAVKGGGAKTERRGRGRRGQGVQVVAVVQSHKHCLPPPHLYPNPR